jgi:hypothetical protein
MGTGGAAVAVLAGKYAELRPHLDERGWRLYLGSEARAYAAGEGCGLAAAVAVVAEAAGVSRAAVMAGAGELAEGAEPMPGRARRPGAGRRKLEDADPGLGAALRDLLEASTRGDPVVAVTWTTLSLREIARQMAARGHPCKKDAIARMMRGDGYSLQGMSRTAEGKQHPDRDAQFRHINAMIAGFTAAGDPVVSVDAKKKEQLGPFYRAGRSWRPRGGPVRVRDHDFPDAVLGKITPYGVYDIAANRGFVSVGTSHDTAAFAVNALRLWWQREGAARYPGARRLLVTCDAGGSNGYTSRLWKDQLARLAAQAGLEITVCHFPPGTSKWNKIEHRLFCHITRTWRARPLATAEDAVAGIAATTTYQGLKVTAVLDGAGYPGGIKISDERMKHLEQRILDRQDTRGEWNYAVRPVCRPGPEPEPGPGRGPDPALPAGLAALAGIGDFPALLAAVAVPWQAAREQRLHLARGRSRTSNSSVLPWKLPFEAIITAAACRQRLGMTWDMLGQILGADRTTISQAARRAIPLLEQHGITREPGSPRISTLAGLLAHAAARGITITGIKPDNAYNDMNPDDTPEPVNLKNDDAIVH